MTGVSLGSLFGIVQPAKSARSARRARLNWILLLALGGVSASGEALACLPNTVWQLLQDEYGSSVSMNVSSSTFVANTGLPNNIVSGSATGGTLDITSLSCGSGNLDIEVTGNAPESGVGVESFSLTVTTVFTILNQGVNGQASGVGVCPYPSLAARGALLKTNTTPRLLHSLKLLAVLS